MEVSERAHVAEAASAGALGDGATARAAIVAGAAAVDFHFRHGVS